MVGQGRPYLQQSTTLPGARWRVVAECGRRCLLFIAFFLVCVSSSLGAEKTVRLRFAWGSGTTAKQRWSGAIQIAGAELTQIQPLGIEADAPVAVRIDGEQLVVSPFQPRGFDGVDVTVRADDEAEVRVELRSEQAPQATSFTAKLGDIATSELRQPLDQLGSFFLAHRAPGDRLRVDTKRHALVFDPEQTWRFSVEPDLATELAEGPVRLELQLRAIGQSEVLWGTSHTIASPPETPLEFELVCPAAEGAYRLTIVARPQEGLATRFVPGQQAKPLLTRDIEFVVIDPNAKLPPLTDQWETELSVDPANPRWWQRLPAWAQVPGLRGRLPGAVGNVRPVVRPIVGGKLVELPPSTNDNDHYWQSYTLPIRTPGEPYLIEVEYPLAAEQFLSISILEPDAAGRVRSVRRDAGFFSSETRTTDGNLLGVHRFLFWPRTKSPQILLVNRHHTLPAQYGLIRLSRQAEASDTEVAKQVVASERLVAGYLTQPIFAESFGAAQQLDVSSGLSVQGWSTFLDGARRLIQSLKFNGYNGLAISIAADGSAIYPSELIRPSPRYDTGMLAASGQDPQRKDVLEMLLRLCDREGIRLVPTLQLATPLPRLEQQRAQGNGALDWVGSQGQSWLQQHSSAGGLAPYYNVLNERVQSEVIALVQEIADRYRDHPSLTGIGLQVSGLGYGVLPDLTWGVDDETVARFSRATGRNVAGEGPDRFQQRAEQLLGPERAAWAEWRANRLTELYTSAAETVAKSRSDLQLLLASEDLFAGRAMQQRLRQSFAEPVDVEQLLKEHGIDLARLTQTPNLVGLASYRFGADERLGAQAMDLHINETSRRAELALPGDRGDLLLYRVARELRLQSFDEQSPFGSKLTQLTLTTQAVSAGDALRRPLAQALARRDAMIVLDGGPLLSRTADMPMRRLLQTWQQLPDRRAEVRTQHTQPLVMRVYRSDQSTTLALVNESPWAIKVQLPLECLEACRWRELGDTREPPTNAQAALPADLHQWQRQLPPYSLSAWRFDSAKIRPGEPHVTVDPIAKIELQRRIKDIEARIGNLNIERPYPQLQNPGFELIEGSGFRTIGWQPRLGRVGAVSVDMQTSRTGQNALRLKSQDASGVAVVSHVFAAPETGQLSIELHARTTQQEEDARMVVVLEDPDHSFRRTLVLGEGEPLREAWTRYELAVDDLPMDTNRRLRIVMHLMGKAELLVDDLALFDLRFDDARRTALAKKIYAAKIALEQDQWIDCLQVVDEYWSRFLVKYVPPQESVPILEAKQPASDKTAEEPEKTGVGRRMRSWVPRLWR